MQRLVDWFYNAYENMLESNGLELLVDLQLRQSKQ